MRLQDLQAISTTKQSRLRIWNTSDFPSPTCQRKQKEITTLWHNRRNLMELDGTWTTSKSMQKQPVTNHAIRCDPWDPLRSMGSMRSGATGATGATGALTASHGSQMTAILHQEARRHHFAEGAKMGPHRRPGSGGTKRGIMTQPETVALCCICWSVKTGTEHLLVANWWRVRKTTQNLAMPCKAGKAWKAKRSNKWFSTRPSFSEEETKRSNRSSKLTRVGMYSANLTPADTRNVWKINALWELG